MSAQWNESTSTGRRRTLRAVNSSGLKLRLEVEGGGHTSALAVPENQWHFAGCTQSGSNINTAVLYANGASAAVPVSVTINTENAFRFGRFNNVGQVCQFAYGLVYNRALSPAEIEQNRQVLMVILASRGVILS
jgi:Concanavalin A-like lectin/glucanases superfamily